MIIAAIRTMYMYMYMYVCMYTLLEVGMAYA